MFVCDFACVAVLGATMSKFLSKNKCNYLQHHSITITNPASAIKIMECWGKLQSNRTESPETWLKILYFLFATDLRSHCAGAAAGKKKPGAPPPTH